MAAATAEKNHLLGDVVECSICTDVFSDPRTLPCKHTYCFRCIADWCKDRQPGDTITCPLCREESLVPKGGLGELPKNAFTRKMLEIRNGLSATSGTKHCDVCSSTDEKQTPSVDDTAAAAADVFCLECQQNMCTSCRAFHSKLSKTKNHTVVSVSNVDAVEHSPTSCDQHDDEKLVSYCFDCKETVCNVCCVEEHDGHSSSEIGKVATQFRVELAGDIESLATAFRRLDEGLDEMRARRTRLNEQLDSVEVEVYEAADCLERMIKERKLHLVADLKKIRDRREDELTRTIVEIEQMKPSLKSLKQECGELHAKGTDCDVACEADDLHMRAKSLTDIACGKYQEAINNLSDVRVHLSHSGAIKESIHRFMGNIFEGEIKPRPLSLHRYSLIIAGNVTALALLDDELFVTRSNIAEVSVYDIDIIQRKRKLTFPGLGGKQLTLATCSTLKYLYVADEEGRCVHRVDSGFCAVSTWKAAGIPLSLSVNTAHNILVICNAVPQVFEYTSTGTLLRACRIGGENVHPLQAVEVSNGILSVTFRDIKDYLCGVMKVSTNGQVVHTYKNSSYYNGTMRGLVVDTRGNVIVSIGITNELLVVNSSLNDARRLLLPIIDKECCPSALMMDQSRGWLYVGNKSDKPGVIVFDNVTNVGTLFNS